APSAERPASTVQNPEGPASTPEAGQTAPSASSAPSADAVVGVLETAKVQRGDSLWRISRSAYGRGARYTVIYAANDGQIRNPNVIYPGQVLVLPRSDADDAAAR
ncbi:LysM peptidoglycan-binding domain-containing protein, partial [Methylopila musalis]